MRVKDSLAHRNLTYSFLTMVTTWLPSAQPLWVAYLTNFITIIGRHGSQRSEILGNIRNHMIPIVTSVALKQKTRGTCK